MQRKCFMQRGVCLHLILFYSRATYLIYLFAKQTHMQVKIATSKVKSEIRFLFFSVRGLVAMVSASTLPRMNAM